MALEASRTMCSLSSWTRTRWGTSRYLAFYLWWMISCRDVWCELPNTTLFGWWRLGSQCLHSIAVRAVRESANGYSYSLTTREGLKVNYKSTTTTTTTTTTTKLLSKATEHKLPTGGDTHMKGTSPLSQHSSGRSNETHQQKQLRPEHTFGCNWIYQFWRSHSLQQGCQTYGLSAQNCTRKYFLGTQRSLLS